MHSISDFTIMLEHTEPMAPDPNGRVAFFRDSAGG